MQAETVRFKEELFQEFFKEFGIDEWFVFNGIEFDKEFIVAFVAAKVGASRQYKGVDNLGEHFRVAKVKLYTRKAASSKAKPALKGDRSKREQ
jgi:uncharacterized protein YprB with RNaseH-like and TPR domain